MLDILGFASSVARKSTYVDLPVIDSAMSGVELNRFMGSVKVMMQDVKTNADTERVSLSTAQGTVERLRPGRLYH